jgi:hypothetical protein
LEHWLSELDEALSNIQKERLDGFRIRDDHHIADFTLWAFLLSAWECGAGVLHLLRTNDLPAPAVPVARACFEASQDAIYLATSPDYDLAGARAQVFELFEMHDIINQLKRAGTNPSTLTVETAYADIQGQVERDCKGVHWAGALALREAYEHFLPRFLDTHKRRKHPGNWAEISRRRMAQELEKRLDEPDLADHMIAMYTLLSHSSHPRQRRHAFDRALSPQGDLLLFRSESVAKQAAWGASHALNMATWWASPPTSESDD